MSQAQIDAVVAGTKGFAVALLAPLTARLGTRPRVAGDPGQILGLCKGPSALAVIEFTGEGSLAAIQALIRDGGGLRVLAGLPSSQAGAEETLKALGVETARWDGKVDAVIAALDRVIGPREAPFAQAVPAAAKPAPPLPSKPAASPPSPPPVSRPASSPLPPLAAPRPPSEPLRAGAGAAFALHSSKAVAVASPPRPVVLARATIPPAPALQAPLAPRPLSHQAPIAPSTRVGVAPRRPAPPLFATPAPAAPVLSPAPPVLSPPPPPREAAEGKAEEPASALSDADSAPPRFPSPFDEPQGARPQASFFLDLATPSEVEGVEGAAPSSPTDFHAAGVYVPPAAAAVKAWPSTLATAADAEEALSRVLGGDVDLRRPLHLLAQKVLQSLSALEKSALSGDPLGVDPAPLKKAAVMRLRVADALSTVPAPGASVDASSLSLVLGEIDGLLSEVNSIAGEAPEELKEPLDAVRNALVREAIDFSEVAQRVAVVAGAPALPRPVLRPLQTRVLSVESEPEYAPSQRRRSALLVVVFLLVLAAGAVFHGRTYYQKKHAHPPQPGIPPGMMALGVARGPRMVTMQTHDGAVDPAELERFREAEKAQGNVVTDAGGGSFIVTPAPPVHPDEAEKK